MALDKAVKRVSECLQTPERLLHLVFIALQRYVSMSGVL